MLKRARPPLPEGCLSDLLIDRWHAGELDEVTLRSAEQHLSDCARCARRAADLSAYARAVRDLLPPLVRRTEERTARTERPRSARRGFAVSIAYACAVLACALVWWNHDDAPEQDGVRAKGTPDFHYFVKRGTQVLQQGELRALTPGDRLRFVVQPAGYGFVVLLSRDPAGQVSVYHGEDEQATALAPGRPRVALPEAIELDGQLGEEHLYGVFCRKPVPLEPLRRELLSTSRLTPPEGCWVVERVVTKAALP
jgi:hypothetical protein